MPTYQPIKLRHGTLLITGFSTLSFGGSLRSEVYFEAIPRDRIRYEHTHAADHNDVTPPHSTYSTGYNEKCGWCYLNAPHTEAAHEKSVKEARR